MLRSNLKLISLIFLLTNISHAASMKVHFKASSNVPGMDVQAEVSSLRIKLIKDSEVIIPLDKIDTGMEIRNQHMNKDVFNNMPIKGRLLDTPTCKGNTCKVDMELTLNNTKKTFTLNYPSSDSIIKTSFLVNLKDFKIPAPSKFGVTIKENIEVQIEIKDIQE